MLVERSRDKSKSLEMRTVEQFDVYKVIVFFGA